MYRITNTTSSLGIVRRASIEDPLTASGYTRSIALEKTSSRTCTNTTGINTRSDTNASDRTLNLESQMS